MSDEHLTAYLVGALEPGLAKEIEEELSASPGLRAHAALLAARIQQAESWAEAWDIPPVGVPAGRGAFTAQLAHGMVMAAGPLAPGDRFSVLLGPVPDAAERLVVVLLHEPEGWRVVFPSHPEESMRADEVPLETDGTRRLDLAAGPHPGTQRWAVALPWLTLEIDWSLPPEERWSDVRAAVADGSVPVSAVRVEVA